MVQRISRLEADHRNLLAHYKGVPAYTRGQFRGKRLVRMQAPVAAAGNVSAPRAYFNAAAPEALAAAQDAIREFHVQISEPLPEFLAVAMTWSGIP
jgi:hypothetical protein